MFMVIISKVRNLGTKDILVPKKIKVIVLFCKNNSAMYLFYPVVIIHAGNGIKTHICKR